MKISSVLDVPIRKQAFTATRYQISANTIGGSVVRAHVSLGVRDLLATTATLPSWTPTFSEAWLDGADGHHFYTRTYAATLPNPKAVLIFVHGFADHISRYETIHPRFAKRGVTVFAYDMRGFGRTALDEEYRSPDEADLERWVRYVRRTYPGTSIFAMGYSAGAGMTLGFATRTKPSSEVLAMVSGIIAQCPLVHLTHRPSRILIWIAYLLSRIAPALPFPADMPEDCFSLDETQVKALKNDPLRRTLLGLYTMGEELLEKDYEHWPAYLPLLMTWGTADEANFPKAGVTFHMKVDAKDKKLVEYDDALHDLLHEIGDIPDKVIEEYIS
ncbi:alpha/beta-hydrolase [Lentinus tigrinus ALCF2SS1-7]|uniref:alpha/beta-hydrolase n=1 Tax=Lentinus tigrinus ALCF2SS1-7 TaxID=1328758 RepID=UPI0011661E2F|nr:alpha/beta-hydrolase [Lentinus tigrinus ALCF2SS1-7]